MDPILKFAAIDIGSNAVRLLLSGVFEEEFSATFRKMSLVRMPIRLGDDAFTSKRISDSKVSQLVKSMIGFKHLIEAFQPLDFMACATSAMREAENGPEICKRILQEADIKIDICKRVVTYYLANENLRLVQSSGIFSRFQKIQNRKFSERRLLSIGLLLSARPARFLLIGDEI